MPFLGGQCGERGCGWAAGDDCATCQRLVCSAIKEGRFTYPPARWAAVSLVARDLVAQLLARDPRGRIPVEQVLEHPWIAYRAPQRGVRDVRDTGGVGMGTQGGVGIGNIGMGNVTGVGMGNVGMASVGGAAGQKGAQGNGRSENNDASIESESTAVLQYVLFHLHLASRKFLTFLISAHYIKKP